MRRSALVAFLAVLSAGLAACTESAVSRIDADTFRIEGPGIAGGSDAPNRRLARQACPKGYRVIESSERREPDWGTFTNWTIRCL
jgi:hypothetical protein